MAISRRRDRHLRFSVVGPGVSGAAEWGSRSPVFCGGLPRGRDRRVHVGDSSTLELDDDGVVREAIEERASGDGIAEDLSPLGEAAVRGRIIAPFSYRALTSWKNKFPPPGVTGR